MQSLNKPGKGAYLLWLLLAAFTVLWFSNLEYRKLIKPDEGRYAEIPREMVASGDWVTPRLNGLKYFEKPPLQYWATAVAYEAFGEHQWTSRLWDALTGLGGILLVWFAGARLFGREAGRYAALVLGGSFLYAAMGHVNTLDIGVTFFIMLGIVGLLLAQQEGAAASTRRNWMYVAWVALGLSVLSKGLMGLVLPGAALFLYSLLQRDFGVWKRMHWGGGLLLLLAVTVPWFYLVIKANPEFAKFFFYHEHIERFLTTVHHRYQPWYFFIPVMVLGMLPWTLLMVDTLWRTWRESARPAPFTFSYWRAFRTPKAFNPERFLLVWTVFVFLFFSKSDSKLPSYMLPIFPSLALLMGWQLTRIGARRLFWQVAGVLPLLLLMLAVTFFSARFADNPLEVEGYAGYAAWLQAALGLWLLGFAAALAWLWRGAKLPAVVVLTFATLVASLLGTSGYNAIAQERSGYAIADAIRPQVTPKMKLYSVEMYEQTLPFYLKRTFTLVEFTDELEFGATQEEKDAQEPGAKAEPRRWLPTLQAFAHAWSKDKQALAIMPLVYYPMAKDMGVPMKEIYRDSQYIVVIKP
jgi:4-amino-4-deoxy-L-arabinose transferase-like glycosyltransferase